MARYFSYFPTVPYDTFDGSGKLKVVTDVFKRVRATLEAQTDKTIYYNYNVLNGQTPEHVAYNYYGSTDYHWVVLLMNDIRDPQWCWPLDDFAFEKYIIEKYGSMQNAADTTHHHETREVKSTLNNDVFQVDDIILPEGIIVESNFSYTYRVTTDGALPGTEYTIANPQAVKAVSNLEYEQNENESRRSIKLLRRNILPEFVRTFESLIIQKR